MTLYDICLVTLVGISMILAFLLGDEKDTLLVRFKKLN